MKKILLKVLSYVLVAAITSGTTVVCFLLAQRNNSTKLWEVETLLSRYFIGDVDQSKLEDAAASAMVSALGDRWSYYMTAEEYKIYQDTMSNSYVGVGITIQPRQDGNGFDILSVTEGAPAQEAGMQAGDILIAVDGIDVRDLDTSGLSALTRGEENTSVQLTVQRGPEEKTFTVTRKKFQTPVATYKMLEGNIGLITIENFDQRCASETIAAIEALTNQGTTALIFDVRNNPGGYKDEMIKVLDYLLPEGPLFRSEDYRGKTKVEYSDKNCLGIPMAVIVNLRSYSAAEFFAAALNEFDAAIIVGEKTFGKGYFQTTIPLSDGSAINLSIGKYTTGKGVSLVGTGLTPEVEIPVDAATAAKILAGTMPAEEDPQIIAAINALTS